MYFYRPYPLSSQVYCKEKLGEYVVVDKDRVVTDRASKCIRNQTKDKKKVLLEQEYCVTSVS